MNESNSVSCFSIELKPSFKKWCQYWWFKLNFAIQMAKKGCHLGELVFNLKYITLMGNLRKTLFDTKIVVLIFMLFMYKK